MRGDHEYDYMTNDEIYDAERGDTHSPTGMHGDISQETAFP